MSIIRRNWLTFCCEGDDAVMIAGVRFPKSEEREREYVCVCVYVCVYAFVYFLHKMKSRMIE